MAKPPVRSVEDKTRIVLSVLSGEMTVAEAARREGVSATAISKWRDTFLEAGRSGLASGARSSPSTREQHLEAENTELKIALGETTAELRVWKKGDLSWWQTQRRSS